MSKRKVFAFCGVVLAVAFSVLAWSSVEAAPVDNVDDDDAYRCKAVVSEAIGELRDQVVACYFDPAKFAEVPGEYTITGASTTNAESLVEAFVRAEPGHGYSWCASNDNGAGGTLFVGPWNTNAEIGRNIGIGQMVYINDSRPGNLDGSCTDFIDPDPSPEGVCYDMDNFAGGLLGSPTDSITINVVAAGITSDDAGTWVSRCPTTGDPGQIVGAEWGGEFAEFCGTCGDPWFDEWFATNDAFPEAWYPDGESGVQPEHACAAVEVEYTLDGVLLNDGNGTVASAVVFPGDSVVITFILDDELFPGETLESMTMSARVRPRNLGGWIPIWQYAELVSGTTWTVDVSHLYTQSHPLALLEFRCADEEGYSYYVDNPAGDWTDEPQLNRACLALTFQFPDPPLQLREGDTLRVGYRMEAPPFSEGDEGVTLLNYSSQALESMASVGPIYDRFGDEIGDDTGYDWHVPAPSDGYFEIVVPELEDPDEPMFSDSIHLTCTDTVGTTHLDGDGVFDCGRTVDCGLGTGGGGQSCYQTAGIGLAPSSWVPGLVKMYVCVLKILVVPEPGFIEGWVEDVHDESLETPPFSFGVVIYDFGAALVDGVENPTGDACFALSIPVGANTSPSEACVGDNMTVSGPQRSLFAMFLIVPTYLGMLLHGFQLLRG